VTPLALQTPLKNTAAANRFLWFADTLEALKSQSLGLLL
jgi:hypothetical protein